MREEIRLGNEALARNDTETAKRYFQELLANGGTLLQERIAANRLREIQEKQEALHKSPPSKPRTRQKTLRITKRDDAVKHKFVRPPDNPLVVIKKH